MAQPSLTRERRQTIIENEFRKHSKVKHVELLDDDQIAELTGPTVLIYAGLVTDPQNVYVLAYTWNYADKVTMIYLYQVTTKQLKETAEEMAEKVGTLLTQMLACVESDLT